MMASRLVRSLRASLRLPQIPFYHGTSGKIARKIASQQLLIPDHRNRFDDEGQLDGYVYITRSFREACMYATGRSEVEHDSEMGIVVIRRPDDIKPDEDNLVIAMRGTGGRSPSPESRKRLFECAIRAAREKNLWTGRIGVPVNPPKQWLNEQVYNQFHGSRTPPYEWFKRVAFALVHTLPDSVAQPLTGTTRFPSAAVKAPCDISSVYVCPRKVYWAFNRFAEVAERIYP